VSDNPVPDGVLLYYIPIPILVTLALVPKGQRSSRLVHRIPQYESGELAPRIRKLQTRKEGLSLAKEKTELALQLKSSPIVEQRAFLKSFVEEIQVDTEKVTVNYTLPMPPKNSEGEVIGVLPFIQHGRPCRSRTCDTLIKS